MGPEAGVDLGDDDLLVFGAEIVDLFGEQRGGVDAMRADLDFARAVGRDHLVGVDGVFEFGGVAGNPEEAEGDGVPAYVVFHDATLAAIAERRPRDWADLAAIPGIGPGKLDRYADEVLEVLAGNL